MRILIYSETDAAKKAQAEAREAGHHASLRNPQYFNPAQFDKNCDGAVADDETILSAYEAAGIKTQRLTEPEASDMAPQGPEGDGESDGENASDLNALTVAQLKELAEVRGIDLEGATKKADIIAAIEAVDGAKPE